MKAETILLSLGEYFQIQDDYLDCYGDPMVIGKHGTDIIDNKCSWLIIQALKFADQNQNHSLKVRKNR
jgi:farnesyl diphosphate synthase